MTTMGVDRTRRWLWHADKLSFGAVLVVCAAAVALFWHDGPQRNETPTMMAHAGFEFGPGGRVGVDICHVSPDLSVDIATDPDEYRPRPGEHVCLDPECTYIVPDGAKWCPKCGAPQDDRDFDGMDDAFEQRHTVTNPDMADGHLDGDGDGFTNIEEYKAGSDPDDPSSVPAPIRLVAIERQLIDVLFRGYAESRKGHIEIQLNWGNDTRTTILPLGSTFRGYSLEELRTDIGRRGEPNYSLILRRPEGDALVLPRSTPVREPERYGVFVADDDPTHSARAYAGMRFEIEGHSYRVVEITRTGARLIGDRGEHISLELTRIKSR